MEDLDLRKVQSLMKYVYILHIEVLRQVILQKGNILKTNFKTLFKPRSLMQGLTLYSHSIHYEEVQLI